MSALQRKSSLCKPNPNTMKTMKSTLPGLILCMTGVLAAQENTDDPFRKAPPEPSNTQTTEDPAAEAASWIIPRIDFQGVTLSEAVAAVEARAKELDPKHNGIHVVYSVASSGDMRMTLNLKDVPVPATLRYIASMNDCDLIQKGGNNFEIRAKE